MNKKRIEYIAGFIVGSAHDGYPIEVALVDAGCSYEEFKKIRKKKVIKKAIKEYRLILTAHYLKKQVKMSGKSKHKINNDLFCRILDTHINSDLFGINDEKVERPGITISVLD